MKNPRYLIKTFQFIRLLKIKMDTAEVAAAAARAVAIVQAVTVRADMIPGRQAVATAPEVVAAIIHQAVVVDRIKQH